MDSDLQTASRWVAKRDAGLNAEERRQLCSWLAADPQHALAFARVDTRRTELDWPLHNGTIDIVLAGLEERARRRRTRQRRTIAAGACAILLFALGTAWRSVHFDSLPSRPPTLVVMEPQRQMLPDGSLVELKAGARIEMNFTDSERRVTLSRGTAHFQVTRSERPFIVSAAGVTARALGTAFSVELDAQEVSVLVTEGRVAVNKESETPAKRAPAIDATPAEPLAVLEAGKSVSVSIAASLPASVPAISEVPVNEVEERLAWRIPRLEFSGTPLIEVVTMVNRHNRQQFVVADPALEQIALSGVLRADKIDALVAMLESDFKVTAVRNGEQIVLQKTR